MKINIDELTEAELIRLVESLNSDPAVDGILVQLPLPKNINEQRVLKRISADKDVDGFHPENLGKLVLGLPTYISATPNGILELLKRYNIPTSGKHCVVMGRSHIVGAPMSILMGQKREQGDCTVTLVHSRTKNIKEITKTADILIVAIGKPEFVTADMVKEGAVVIDVGVNRVDGKLVGDCDFENINSS